VRGLSGVVRDVLSLSDVAVVASIEWWKFAARAASREVQPDIDSAAIPAETDRQVDFVCSSSIRLRNVCPDCGFGLKSQR